MQERTASYLCSCSYHITIYAPIVMRAAAAVRVLMLLAYYFTYDYHNNDNSSEDGERNSIINSKC